MRKITKIISLVLILITMMGLCSGCMQDEGTTVIKFGIPYKEGSNNWKMFQTTVDEINLYKESDKIKIELVEVPEKKKEREQFLKDMDSGEIAMFMYDRDELVDKYIKNGRLATITDMQKVWPACYLEYSKSRTYLLDTSTDSDGMNHMLALAGSYQGVFFNESIFIEHNLQIPKTWEQFTAVINTLKTAGVTPIAAGFADEGLTYWMDELILMEGGVAEHSYVPKYGVINSWSRAMDDFKGLYDMGAFNKDSMEMKHADAVKMFNEGKAAMIVSPSKEVVTEDMDLEEAGVFALPVTATGKKEIGDIICDFHRGVYINSAFLKKKEAVAQTTVEIVVDYLNKIAEEDTENKREDEAYGPPIPSDYSYYTYSEPWMCPADPYTIGIEQLVFDEYGDIIDDKGDPTVQEKVKDYENLDARVFTMLENVSYAGRSLTQRFKTIDFFVDKVKEYTVKNGNTTMKEEILVEVTDKEISEQE